MSLCSIIKEAMGIILRTPPFLKGYLPSARGKAFFTPTEGLLAKISTVSFMVYFQKEAVSSR
jgi:hypothetical protein